MSGFSAASEKLAEPGVGKTAAQSGWVYQAIHIKIRSVWNAEHTTQTTEMSVLYQLQYSYCKLQNANFA